MRGLGNDAQLYAGSSVTRLHVPTPHPVLILQRLLLYTLLLGRKFTLNWSRLERRPTLTPDACRPSHVDSCTTNTDQKIAVSIALHYSISYGSATPLERRPILGGRLQRLQCGCLTAGSLASLGGQHYSQASDDGSTRRRKERVGNYQGT